MQPLVLDSKQSQQSAFISPTMNAPKPREQAEPTMLRAKPLLGGVNTQHQTGRQIKIGMQGNRRWSKGNAGWPGTLCNWLGKAWNPLGKGSLGRGRWARGDQWGRMEYGGKQAPSAAPAAVLGKGARPWGGRGCGWDRRVLGCFSAPVVPSLSSPPGCPPWGKGVSLPGSERRGPKGNGRPMATGVRPGDKACGDKWQV